MKHKKSVSYRFKEGTRDTLWDKTNHVWRRTLIKGFHKVHVEIVHIFNKLSTAGTYYHITCLGCQHTNKLHNFGLNLNIKYPTNNIMYILLYWNTNQIYCWTERYQFFQIAFFFFPLNVNNWILNLKIILNNSIICLILYRNML